MVGFVGDTHRLLAEADAIGEVADLSQAPEKPTARADREYELKTESLGESPHGDTFRARPQRFDRLRVFAERVERLAEAEPRDEPHVLVRQGFRMLERASRGFERAVGLAGGPEVIRQHRRHAAK